MKYRMLWLPLALLFAGWGFTQEGASDSQDKIRLAQFQRDEQLIEAFVKSGLELASENDPLQRARLCQDLADQVAQQIRAAANRRDGLRTADLASWYQDVLMRGVADNLTIARQNLPVDSPRAKEIWQVGEKVALIAKPLEQDIKTLPAESQKSMQESLQSITEAKEEVANSVQGKGRQPSSSSSGDDKGKIKGKGPPHGKGKGKIR